MPYQSKNGSRDLATLWSKGCTVELSGRVKGTTRVAVAPSLPSKHSKLVTWKPLRATYYLLSSRKFDWISPADNSADLPFLRTKVLQKLHPAKTQIQAVLCANRLETHCSSSTELKQSSAVKSITPLRKKSQFFSLGSINSQ